MKKLPTDKRVQIVSCLVEGCSIRATSRMTGVSKDTVVKLLVDMGCVCSQYHDESVRGLSCQRVQCDEIWAFCGAKQKNVEKGADGYGDIWTWTAIDADTKLCISYLIGGRDASTGWDFMNDLAGRIVNRMQLTTDGHNAYLGAVIDNFGPLVDYAQLVKLYGDDPRLKNQAVRYSPGYCKGAQKYVRIGCPDQKHISTSYVERQNLTMRMNMRRFTRLTNAFSKKVENHGHAVALHFMYYNFCRVHKTLRVTPAMEAGITDHVWSIADLVGLLEAQEQEAVEAGSLKRGSYSPRNSN